jgi:hypothetical protein
LGALRRVVLAFMFGGELVTLLDSRARTDDVQMSVALDRTIMEAFASNFFVPAGSCFRFRQRRVIPVRPTRKRRERELSLTIGNVH